LETDTPAAALLNPLWQGASPEQQEKEAMLALVDEGRRRLRHWRESGFPDLELFFQKT
jgi:hypothetical protein